MIDPIKIANNVVDYIKRRLVADSNNSKYLRLNLGKAVSVQRPSSMIASRKGVTFLEHSNTTWIKINKPFCIYPEKESNPHIVIAGMSGFGKSTLFKSLLIDIRKLQVSCIIFDAHDEHSDLVRELGGQVHNALYSAINILELDGASVSERISELSRLFKDVYSLGYIQATKLSECLWYTYRKVGASSRMDRKLDKTPTIVDLLDELSIFIRNSKSLGERNTLLHLRDRLSLLNSSAFSGQLISTENIERGLHSFSLGGMKSKEARIIYIGELLSRIYAKMHDSQRQDHIKLYVMVDEAQFLVDESGSSSIITKIVEEGRKYGVGVIIVTHAACTLNKKIMANCATFVTFYAREPSEVNYVAKVLSGSDPDRSDAVRRRIGALKGNEAMIVTGTSRNPTVISTPMHQQIRLGDSEASESEAIGFFRARARKPIKMRVLENARIRINSRTIAKLNGSGFLDSFAFMENGKSEEWLMLHNSSLSIAHEVHVRKISDILAAKSIHHKIIDNSNGPDISAVVNGKRMAIEYETGSKSYESTKRMIDLRLKSYGSILIVTNTASIKYYSNSFASEKVKIISFGDVSSCFES